jgi:hypothetical protein
VSISKPYVKLTAAMPACAAIFNASQKRQAIMTPARRVAKTNLLSSDKLSARKIRSSFPRSQLVARKSHILMLTSTKFRSLLAKIGHRIFNAISLNALAILRPRASAIPVVAVL